MTSPENSTGSLNPEAGKDWTDPVLGMDFVWISALGMWIGKYQVTNGEFRKFRPQHSSGEFEGHSLDGNRQPVSRVSFEDGMGFCQWLREELDKSDLDSKYIIRLPSHTEWPVFASCGEEREFPWGNEWPPKYGNYGDEAAKQAFPEWDVIANYYDGHAVSCPVEESGRNEWGLYGVGGNVYEWTFEAEGTSTELRGASWSTFQKEYIALSNRYRREPGSRLVNFGFRILMLA